MALDDITCMPSLYFLVYDGTTIQSTSLDTLSPKSLEPDGVQNDTAVDDDERQEDDEDRHVAYGEHLEDAVRRDLPLEPPDSVVVCDVSAESVIGVGQRPPPPQSQ